MSSPHPAHTFPLLSPAVQPLVLDARLPLPVPIVLAPASKAPDVAPPPQDRATAVSAPSFEKHGTGRPQTTGRSLAAGRSPAARSSVAVRYLGV